MNLKELLLQFAGDNERSLQLEDLLTTNISNIEIEKSVRAGVKILVEEPTQLEEIKNNIKKLLEENGYESFTIIPTSQGELQHILVETD